MPGPLQIAGFLSYMAVVLLVWLVIPFSVRFYCCDGENEN
jgi:hypothetical protein